MQKRELIKRYLLLAIGLLITGIGVAFAKRSGLGVSPISSVANVASEKWTFFTIGTWLLIWNCLLIVLQAILLRREFGIKQILQIPLSFVFGWFTDFGVWLVSPIPNEPYAMKLVLVFLGIVVVGLGIALCVIANVIMNSGDAATKIISDKTGIVYGNVKVAFDVTCVVCAVLLSLALFDMRIVGTREGTILSAIFTGMAVRFFQSHFGEKIEGFLTS